MAGGHVTDRRADVLLADGTTVVIRPIEPSDADAIVQMHGRFSDRTRYLRYFSPYPRIPARDLARFVNVDHHDREAFVVESADRSHGVQLIAVGRYERLGPQAPDAEVAFVVEDAHQGRGISSVLLEHLAQAAREEGIATFVAEVLPSNGAMVRVFVDAGYDVSRRYADGVVHLTFPVAPTERSRAVQWERERRTEARSVARLLRPAGVAVYGASRSGRGVGAALLAHLRGSAFPGPVHEVHPDGPLRSLSELPSPAVDLAVVATPVTALPQVVADAAAAGVHGLVVITEMDPAQRDELVRLARASGMRIIGPASLGVADRTAALNATLVPRLPPAGRVALFCQSGTLGLQLLAEADRRELGVGSFVSVGRRADVSGNDLLQFWATDPETDVIAMYLETFGNPRKFARIARNVSRHRPVVVLAGRTGVIGSTLDPAAMQALRAHSGVIEVGTVSELFDVTELLASQPLPTGDRIGVVSNAFPLAALAAAEIRAAGLTVGRMAAVSPAATPSELANAVRTVLASEDADAVVVIVAPPLPTGAVGGDRVAQDALVAPYAQALTEAVAGADRPVVASFLTGRGPNVLPTYRSIEEAVRALAHVVRRGSWLREPAGDLPPSVAPRSLPDPAQLNIEELLGAYGVPVVPSTKVCGVDQALAAAVSAGYPVAVKLADQPSRIDLGAVRLNLAAADEVTRAVIDLEQLFGAEVELLVQPMVRPGISCVVEVIDDPAFGPVVGFGLGGPVTELVGDRAWRAAPLTDKEARSLVAAPRAAALLAGGDHQALAELLLRVGQLADEVPQLRRLTLNPVLVRADGWSVLHATGDLQPSATRPDTGPRHL
jgi:acyl-CoA synthetase (NDP forming)/GNAT superfamily N-acetyltransferase